MTDKSEKDKIIRQIYYDVDTGFSSVSDTYKASKKILNTITYNDVKDFLERQKVRQFKAYRGFNSYVASKPLQEIQIDIAIFTDSTSDNSGFKYAFVAIDIFSKYMWVVAIRDKQPAESVRAMKEVLEKIGIPETLYHDFEGSWNSKQFIQLINQHNIKQVITSSPPPFAERAVQEFKNMIHTRLEGLNMNKENWLDLLPVVVKQYNSRTHGTTELPPNEARKPENQIEVYLNIRQKAQFKRRYPDLKISDEVRVYVKKTAFKKGYESNWTKDVYKIVAISQDGKQYLVNNNTRRLYSRHELLKIRGVETKDG